MTAAASRKKKVQQEKRHDSQKELENSRALNQNLNTLKQEIKRTSHTLGRLNRRCYFVDKDINYWHRNINTQKGDQAGFQHKPRMIQDNGTQSGLWSLKRLLALLVGSADTEYCRRLCLVSSLLQQKNHRCCNKCQWCTFILQNTRGVPAWGKELSQKHWSNDRM